MPGKRSGYRRSDPLTFRLKRFLSLRKFLTGRAVSSSSLRLVAKEAISKSSWDYLDTACSAGQGTMSIRTIDATTKGYQGSLHLRARYSGHDSMGDQKLIHQKWKNEQKKPCSSTQRHCERIWEVLYGFCFPVLRVYPLPVFRDEGEGGFLNCRADSD